MLNVTFNPPQIEEDYLECLNACFEGWGNHRTFNWIFRRKLSFPDTDLMILKNEKHGLLAGSGITYRLIRLPNSNTITIGIMTGSWTLPSPSTGLNSFEILNAPLGAGWPTRGHHITRPKARRNSRRPGSHWP